MTVDEIRNNADLMRSPQVLTCIEDYLRGQCYPLSVVYASIKINTYESK